MADGTDPGWPAPEPPVVVHVNLSTAVQVRMDRCIGDVPVLDIITTGARLVVGVDIGHVQELRSADVVAANHLANAARAFHDELLSLTTSQCPTP